eukprot:4028883-Amphidinium_carterae.1
MCEAGKAGGFFRSCRQVTTGKPPPSSPKHGEIARGKSRVTMAARCTMTKVLDNPTIGTRCHKSPKDESTPQHEFEDLCALNLVRPVGSWREVSEMNDHWSKKLDHKAELRRDVSADQEGLFEPQASQDSTIPKQVHL